MKGEQPPVSGGGATTYEPAPEAVQCGQWIPAPVVVGGDGPPEPIAAPVDAGAPTDGSSVPAAPATTPAQQLPTWPQWNEHFTRLGLSQDDLAKLAAANLNDSQLAQIYEEIHQSIVEQGGVPGQTPVGDAGAAAWTPEWEQRFLALGLPQEFVAELKAEALRTGADDARIAAVYETVVREIQQQQGTQPVTQDPTVQQPPVQQDANRAGWNAEFEQAFRSLGMPDEVIAIYAQSGAPASGLEAALKHASGRVEDLRERGWLDKLADAKADPLQTWSLILGDEPATDKDLRALYNASKNANMSGLQKGGQLLTSIIPGGRLAQYVFGKEFVSGEEIDRTSPMEIGMAALSGLALLASIRGVRNLGQAWKLRDAGYLQLNGVNKTLESLGMPVAGGGAAGVGADVAMGATQTWGAKQKLLSLIPGTKLHREVIGLAHAETAAKAFNSGAAERLLAQPGGKLQVATLGQLFEDVRTGVTAIHGGKNAYLGPLRSPKALMTFGATKQGAELITVAKNINLGGNGQTQLIGMLQAGGTKLGQSPTWLQNAPNLVDDIARLANIERQSLGGVMAGNAVRTLDVSTFTRDGLRPLRMVSKLGAPATPEWFTRLGEVTSKQIGTGALTPEKHALLTETGAWASILDEASGLVKGTDRSKLADGIAPLVDDAGAAVDDLKAGIERVRATGTMDEATAAAMGRFQERVGALQAADPKLAERLFPSYVDVAKFERARYVAGNAVLESTGAATAAATGAGATAATTGAGTAAGTAAARPIGPMTAAEAAATSSQSVPLTVGANGRVHTPAGLEIPGHSSLVSGMAPSDLSSDTIRRLAEMQRAIRGGA